MLMICLLMDMSRYGILGVKVVVTKDDTDYDFVTFLLISLYFSRGKIFTMTFRTICQQSRE